MQKDAIVLDNGSTCCRIGFAGDDEPRKIFILDQVLVSKNEKEFAAKGYCSQQQSFSSSQYPPNPIERGVVKNWDLMTEMWSYGFQDKLKIKPEEHKVLITQVFNTCLKNREKMAEVMFETFSVPAFYVQDKALLSIYTAGRVTAFVVYSGGGVTYTLPNFHGYSLRECMERIEYGGRDVEDRLCHLINEKSQKKMTRGQLKEIKQRFCYVPNAESQIYESSEAKQFKLPDGSSIQIDQKCLESPNILFAHSNGPLTPELSLQDLILKSISKCQYSLRPDFYQNIILSGGNTKLTNLQQRLHYELLHSTNSPVNIAKQLKIVNASHLSYRDLMGWIGGSILTSLTSFQKVWITKEEYAEKGSFVVERCK